MTQTERFIAEHIKDKVLEAKRKKLDKLDRKLKRRIKTGY